MSTTFKIFGVLAFCCCVAFTLETEKLTDLEVQTTRQQGARGFGRMFTKTSSGYQTCTSNNRLGICVPNQNKCRSRGGTSSGDNCSNNGGVCCVIQAQGGTNTSAVTIYQNLTHLVEPTNYDPPVQYRFLIPKPKNVCQLRLDFVRFSLQGADFNGNCQSDSMVITGADNLGTFVTCGDADGQHLYLHYGAADTITVSFNLMNGMNGGRGNAIHDVLVTMIPCSSNLRAPAGCTQYFRQTSDVVQSFNYPNQQLNDHRYSVCVQTFDGSSRIRWEKCPNSTFSISGNGLDRKSMTGSMCSLDYIDILGGGRYCGSEFAESVISTARPYVMYVNFNQEEFPSPGELIDPVTLCPIGWGCMDPGTGAQPPANTPCTDPFVCVFPPAFLDFIDSQNTGFCLRYTVS